jgi:hypothetical protein
VLGGGGERLGTLGSDRIEPAGEDGVTQPVADQLARFGDADVNGPFLGADAGQSRLTGCRCHPRAAAEDRDGRGLELGVPARNLPARGQGHGIDPVAGLALAVVAEDRGEDGTAGAGDAGQFGQPGHGVGEVVEHERGGDVVDRVVGER